MPIKRRLNKAELDQKRRSGLKVSAFEEHTFLTDEERTVLSASLDANDTTDEFLARFGADVAEGDRDALAAEYDKTRNLRIAARKSRDQNARWKQEREDQPIRQRQPVSPTNPFGAYLDPRHSDLPEYPATGNAQRTRLAEAANDYRDAADVLDKALAGMTDEFAEAFAREDERRAVKERMKNTANPKVLQDHRQRMNRIG